MKTIRPLLTLLIFGLILSVCGACRPQNDRTTYTVNEVSLNSNFLPYSFEYPSDWVIEEGVNHITFTSDAKLLTDVPDKLEPGQIIAGLSMNINMPPEETVDVYASTHQSVVEFSETISYEVNGRPAAYKEGTETESGDQLFLIAVDMGNNMRGFLTAKMAEGELVTWRDTLMKMAESLRVNP